MHHSQRNKTYNRFVGGILAMTLLIISLLVVFSFTAKAQTSQYASSVIGYSTQYSTPSWAATQATGVPNVAGCTDNASAWASLGADNQREYLILGFTTAQQVDQITIDQANAPGAIDTVWLRNSSTLAWNNVWNTTAAPGACANLVINIAVTSYSVDAVRIAVNSPAVASWNEIDAVQISFSPPMAYSSSTTTQNNTSSVGVNSTNNEVIGIQIVTSGSSSPLSATSFSLNTTGTTNAAVDITNAKIWYTGTSSLFATATLFGTVAVPNGAFTITGTQTLSGGTNYFWLSYDVTAGATVNNFIDGECTSLTVTIPRTPIIAAPGGNRQIANIIPPTFQCVSTATATGASLTITTPACVALNDVMIAHLAADATSGGSYTTVPAGWNLIRILDNTTYLYSVSYYKIATAFEPASYTFTFSGASIWNQAGGILVYRGVDTCSPIDAEAGQLTPSSTSHSTPSITTTASQDMIVSLFAIDYTGSGPWSPPAGMTERDDINGTDEDLEAADVVQASPGATGVKTATCATAVKGTAQIIALKANTAMIYSSSTTTQNNTSLVGVNTTNNEIIGIQIVTTGCSSALSTTSFALNTTGTTAPATDITNAKIWYTGISSSFATTTLFGTVAVPNGAFTITGTQTLSGGTNYFWLTYDIPSGATANNFIDGECTSLTVTIPRTPTVTAPSGNRKISPWTPPTFQCSSTNWGSCGSGPYNIAKPACVTTNDLMIAHFTYVQNTGDAGITPPAGWTQLFLVNPSGSPTMTAFYKISTGSEPASYAFSGTSNGADHSMTISVYRGVDVSSPIEASGAVATSGTSHTTPCIAATTDLSMVVALFGLANCSAGCPTSYNCASSSGGGGTTTAWTPPSGMTERYDYGGVQNAGRTQSGNDVMQPTGGCAQKTATSSPSAAGVAAILTLRPSGAVNTYTCTGCVASPLPVEWLSFTAKLIEEKKVKLNWATASEINNNYFTVERSLAPSPAGEGWGEVGTVKGAGNSSTIRNYEFVDAEIPSLYSLPATFYYRIKQTDFDGKFDYSNIASVFIAPEGFYISELFPNPADDMTNVFVSSSDETTLSVIMYSNVGQKVSSDFFSISKGSNQLSLNVSNFAQGIYTVAFSTKDKTIYKKISIIKSASQ